MQKEYGSGPAMLRAGTFTAALPVILHITLKKDTQIVADEDYMPLAGEVTLEMASKVWPQQHCVSSLVKVYHTSAA
jgi:hypothetical protein